MNVFGFSGKSSFWEFAFSGSRFLFTVLREMSFLLTVVTGDVFYFEGVDAGRLSAVSGEVSFLLTVETFDVFKFEGVDVGLL